MTTTYYNGVRFCDLSAFDQEQVNQGIIDPDPEVVVDYKALIDEAVQSLLIIGHRPGCDPGVLAVAYKLRGY